MSNIIQFPERTHLDPTEQFDEPAKVIILPVLRIDRPNRKRKIPIRITSEGKPCKT